MNGSNQLDARSGRQIDRFDFLVSFQSFRTADAPDAGFLVTAERRIDLQVQSVNGHVAGANPLRQRQALFGVLGEDGAA